MTESALPGRSVARVQKEPADQNAFLNARRETIVAIMI